MAIRDDFEVVASQVRTVVQRFALGLLVIAAFGVMLVGKADTVLVEHARVLALDMVSPVLEAIARPVAYANRAIADLREFASLREENARLREENARLLAWQTAARRLENENEGLRSLAKFREGPEASFITARLVGDNVDFLGGDVDLHPGVLESFEAAFIGGVLGLVRATRAEQKAQQLGGDTNANANQNEKDDRQVLLNVHHDVGPQMEQIV